MLAMIERLEDYTGCGVNRTGHLYEDVNGIAGSQH